MTLHPVPQLTPARKSVYALGDFTVNTALSTLNLIYAAYFLTQVAGLRPALAGLVPLIGRFLDAFTDPLMGRISDQTTWQAGRRRPYFLLGAIPFGLSFAMLWTDPPFSNEIARFGYYTATYCVLTTAMTVLSVPYLSLLPEMALGYDERTSLNAYRNFGSLMGIFAAISIRPLANLFGGGFGGFASAGIAFGVMLTLPWVAVYAVSFERPRFAHRPHHSTFRAAMGSLLHHGSFLRLTGLYLAGRIAMDVVGTMLILYFTFWISARRTSRSR